MKKLFLVVLSLSMALSACMPEFIRKALNPVPTKNVQATATILYLTRAAETISARPTSTQSPTSTPPPTSTETATPIPATQTFTETATLFSTETTGTAYTPTNITGTPAPATATATPGGPTETPHARYYGTQPPAVPFGKLLMMNKSHVDAYISLQCTTKDKILSIEEYPVGKWMLVRIASGKCNYVAWVGGRQFTGSFTLPTGDQRTITIYKNRIKIK